MPFADCFRDSFRHFLRFRRRWLMLMPCHAAPGAWHSFFFFFFFIAVSLFSRHITPALIAFMLRRDIVCQDDALFIARVASHDAAATCRHDVFMRRHVYYYLSLPAAFATLIRCRRCFDMRALPMPACFVVSARITTANK